MKLTPISVHDASEIERDVTAFARSANGGLIVPGSALATFNRTLIVTLAARNKLPVRLLNPVFVTDGGLMAHGPDRVDDYRLGSRLR